MRLGSFFTVASVANAQTGSRLLKTDDGLTDRRKFERGHEDLERVAVKVPLPDGRFFGLKTDSLWIGLDGTVSIDSPDGDYADHVERNLILAPFWTKEKASFGKVQWSIGTKQDEILSDIQSSPEYSSFEVSSMIIVGFCRVLNPYNSEEENCHQVGYVTGKDGRDAIWIKYHQLDWVPEDVSVGIFAGRKESEQCYSSLISASVEELLSGSNIDSPGVWVIPADGNGKLHCSKQFETECPEPQEGGRAVWNGHVSLSDDIDGWNFFAEYGCLPKHEMVDGSDRKTVQCLYDPDYYDSRWGSEPPTCKDPNAMQRFSVNMFHDQFLWPDPLPMVSLPPLKVLGQTGRELDDSTSGSIIGSIARIGRPMGNITTNIGANIGRTGKDIKLNFEIGVSSYGRMTADDVRRQLFDIFGDVKGQISDTSDVCLTECLGCKSKECNGNPPPIPYNACCGPCEVVNGKIISQAKPYSTLIHACCPGEVKGEFLYDPLKSACCPYEDGNILVPVNVYSSFGKDQAGNCAATVRQLF